MATLNHTFPYTIGIRKPAYFRADVENGLLPTPRHALRLVKRVLNRVWNYFLETAENAWLIKRPLHDSLPASIIDAHTVTLNHFGHTAQFNP